MADDKIAKMRALTEPVVNDLLGVLRNYKQQLNAMRDMDDFANARDSLAVVVSLRDMLTEQTMVPGAVYRAPPTPDYSHLNELESKKLSAVFGGSMTALFQVEMKLYALRNQIASVTALERAVELTMLLRKLKNAVPESAFDELLAQEASGLGGSAAGSGNGGGNFGDASSSASFVRSPQVGAAARQRLLDDGLAVDDIRCVRACACVVCLLFVWLGCLSVLLFCVDAQLSASASFTTLTDAKPKRFCKTRLSARFCFA